MKAKIELFMSKYRLLGSSTSGRPTYPFHLDVLFKSKSGCSHYCNIFNNAEAQNDNPMIMWINIVEKENLDITIKERWKRIYKICFYSVCDNNVTKNYLKR